MVWKYKILNEPLPLQSFLVMMLITEKENKLEHVVLKLLTVGDLASIISFDSFMVGF